MQNWFGGGGDGTTCVYMYKQHFIVNTGNFNADIKLRSHNRYSVLNGHFVRQIHPSSLNPHYPRCFVPSLVGSWEEDENVKSLQTDGLTTDNRWSEKLTFKSFQLGELKTHCTGNNIIWRQVTLFLKHNYVICKLTQEFYRR